MSKNSVGRVMSKNLYIRAGLKNAGFMGGVAR